MRTLFTSESVTEGHPDKICDQISDGILDALLAIDPNSRCACETTAEPGAVHIMGEITTAATVNYIEIARQIIREIGYTKPEYGFDADTCEISCSLHTQSADIAQGVDMALEAKEAIDTDGLGAGDQGMMFGFACDETPERMPLPITLAHRITRRLAAVRKNGELSYLRPDGKAQVTVEYENGKPVRVNTVVLSTQHDEDADPLTLRQDMIERVIKPCIPAEMLDDEDMPVSNGEREERSEGEFSITAITDNAGNFVSPRDLEIRLQTLPTDEGYWLDTGVVNAAN